MSSEHSAERPIPLSEMIKEKINPVRARIISTAFNPIFYQTDNKIADDKRDEFKEKILNATPGSIDFKPVIEESTNNRRDYWKDKAFDEQNMEWNKATWKIVQNMIKPENPELEDVKKAFGAIGLDPDDTSQTGTSLNTQIEQFREKYFEGNSKVKEFVSDIAEGCIEDGSVNVSLVEKRLRAINKLLGAFGKTDVTELVKEYAISYSLLAQQREVKEIVAETVFSYISAPNPQPLPETPPVTQSEAETERAPIVKTQSERKRGFLGFLESLIPFAGLAGIAHLGRRTEETRQTSSGENSSGRESVGDTGASTTSTTDTRPTDNYYTETDQDSDNNSDRDEGNREDYVDIGASDYGDRPGQASESGGFTGYSDVGEQDQGSVGDSSDTGGFTGYSDVGAPDHGSMESSTDSGGPEGYQDIGDSDYGSGERATETGGFAGYGDIGAPDRGSDEDSDNDSDSDGDGD